MRRFALLALLLTISAQPAPEPQVDWRWERDTPICSLKQVVSADGTTIQISRTPANDETSVSVAGRDGSMSVASVILRDGKILFVPGGETSGGTIYLTKRNGSGDVYALIDDTNFLSNVGRSSAIEFTHAKIAPLRLPVRSGAAAVSALRSCEDRTMREGASIRSPGERSRLARCRQSLGRNGLAGTTIQRARFSMGSKVL